MRVYAEEYLFGPLGIETFHWKREPAGLSDTEGGQGSRNLAILRALKALPSFPVEMDEPRVRECLASRDALDAVIAARCAAWAVLSGEADLGPADLAPGEGDRVRLEGWIYGLREPA